MKGAVTVNNNILLIILGMALVTYITRVGSIVLFKITGIPSWIEAWLKHVPTAILTALIIPALFLPKGYLDISLNNNYLIAGVIAAFVAYRSRNIVLTIGLGMSAMLCLNWLIM